MKDLRFRGTIGSDEINVTFRCNMFSENQNNITVMSITNGVNFNPNDQNEDVVQKHFGAFKKTNISLKDLKDLATNKGLDLYVIETNGEEKSLLVDGDPSISE